MKYLIILTMVFSSCIMHAQHENQIREDIGIYNKAYLEGDYDKYVKYTIQSVVQMGGGAELMKEVALAEAKLLEESNSKIVDLGPKWFSQTYESVGAIHVVVGQQLTLDIGDDTFVKTSYYLAESIDEGRSWAFIDLEPYNKEVLAIYIPGISEEIVLPELDAAIKVEK